YEPLADGTPVRHADQRAMERLHAHVGIALSQRRLRDRRPTALLQLAVCRSLAHTAARRRLALSATRPVVAVWPETRRRAAAIRYVPRPATSGSEVDSSWRQTRPFHLARCRRRDGRRRFRRIAAGAAILRRRRSLTARLRLSGDRRDERGRRRDRRQVSHGREPRVRALLSR